MRRERITNNNTIINKNETNNRRDNNKKRKKKKSNLKTFLKFIAYELVFGMITGPAILLYGPFDNAKSIFVGTAMNSMHYNWLATTFLSDEKINDILGKSTQEESSTTEVDENLIKVSKNYNSNIKYQILDGNDNFVGHVLTVASPSRIHIGYTSKLNDENKVGETTSQIAINNDAVAAVNGGAFKDEANSEQWTANGGTPSGVIISNGEVLYDDLKGRAVGMIGITKGGILIVGQYTLNQLVQKKVTEAVSFDTTLLVSGGKMTPMKGDGGGGSSPRTLIGQKADGSIILVVLDARVDGSRVAATLKEAQEVMYKLDCVTAGTLDGGKSATMYYDDDVVNNPSYAYGERSIPTAIIVK